MSFLRRKSTDVPESAEADLAEPEQAPPGSAPKGRPTPKRRTTAGPITPAPKTRKEAAAWQKQHANARVAGQKKLTTSEYRQAVRSGEVLPRRDQGPVRALARDYVDSRRMASNYLLWLFPLLLIGYFVPYLQILTFVLFLLLLAEWILAGTRIKRLAGQRGQSTRESALSLGFYAGSRAYFKRSWRRPLPVKQIGDEI
ncbi:MAG TPA: DUF3043 domain-containing protein [Jatrophihabitans sp.]|nr:DUF3043 domain-containing protein [Jatrophihabitans sp.]